MSDHGTPIRVSVPAGGFARSDAVAAVRDSGLAQLLSSMAPSPFGHTSLTGAILEGLVEAVDLGLAAAATLEGAILGELATAGSFAVATLAPPHHRLLAACQIVITADDAYRRITQRCPAPQVDGALELDGLDELLSTTDPAQLAARVLRLARGYVELKTSAPDGDADAAAGTTAAAFFRLLSAAVQLLGRTGSVRPMVEALSERKVTIAGYPYRGLVQQAPTETPSGLLPITVDDIVGNREYVDAGKRLARDVAGFDFERGRNPKRVNPVLFGLGSPGSGKTVTAHAIGNYFLSFCREREIAARFVVVRRSDWASSYQNASAANLIRLFREEVYGFEGVCGVYWPDIDTALASRSNAGLRTEEKQNLGAVFGVFDGTLLPKDGKWFMICDANTIHMDEAAISRIAQNPFTVDGPTSLEHYVRLMRDLMLRDLTTFLPSDEETWKRIAGAAVSASLSGRHIENICGNIRAHIQDFEYPDDYFVASSAEQDAIIARLSRPVDEAFVLDAIADFSKFQKEAHARDEQDRFDQEVDTVVRQLNASREAMERAANMGLGTKP